MSERIRNEIIPLLQNSNNEEEMDELDDEVAMISNKHGPTNEEILKSEDIKIEIKGTLGSGGDSLATRGVKSATVRGESSINAMAKTY